MVLTKTEVDRLWQATIQYGNFSHDQVNIKYVSEAEIRTLNKQYRGKDVPTNVLTFNYPSTSLRAVSEHDIALCLEVAKREAAERSVPLRDYVALLLVHAFLHAVGLDHEWSEAEATKMEKAEREILQQAGFPVISWGM